jgi:hypothetical protein
MWPMKRRSFLQQSAFLCAAGLGQSALGELSSMDKKAFAAHQVERRKLLWSLLGDLPEKRAPTAVVTKTEKHDGFTLQRLEMDLNGIVPVPAYLLIPDKIKKPAPGMLYIHWHGGNYPAGKEELLIGTGVMKPYAPAYAKKGIVTLAIDSWCFGERMPYPKEGGRGESDTFKEMLWKGRVLWGMMMFDEWQALNYLCARPEVDDQRVGSFGISMGSTKSWWLAALDERIKCCIDLCCLTEFDSLIKTGNLRGHGIYYYVPSLLKHFSTAQINELIVPRPHLSLNGRFDKLTPPEGVELIRDHLEPLYRKYGNPEDNHIELFDCKHQELPEMRALVLEFLDKYLVAGAPSQP